MRFSGLGPESPWLHARAGGSSITATESVGGGSGDLLPSSPPAEKATASKDQARKASTDDGTGHRDTSPFEGNVVNNAEGRLPRSGARLTGNGWRKKDGKCGVHRSKTKRRWTEGHII